MATISLLREPHFPAQKVGDTIAKGDLVGIKAVTIDGVSRLMWVRALAHVTGKVEALGIAPMDAIPGQENFAPQRFARMSLLAADITGELASLVPGDKLYLSSTVPGKMTRTKLTTATWISQVVGTAFWEGSRKTGIKNAEAANAIQMFITPAVDASTGI